MSVSDPMTMATSHARTVQKEARSAVLAAENALLLAYESDAGCDEIPMLRTALRDCIIAKANSDLVLKLLSNAHSMDPESLADLSEQLDTQAKVDYRNDNTWQKLIERGINMNMDEDSDEEIVVAGIKRTIHCPLSLDLLVRPLTNDGCKHAFSELAILALLKDKPSISCPVPGCKSMVSRQSLKRDPELERFVAKEARQQAANASNMETFAID